jgi:hypothetical protein
MDNKVKDMGNQVNLFPYHKTAGDSTNESRPEPVESPGLDIMPICSLKWIKMILKRWLTKLCGFGKINLTMLQFLVTLVYFSFACGH